MFTLGIVVERKVQNPKRLAEKIHLRTVVKLTLSKEGRKTLTNLPTCSNLTETSLIYFPHFYVNVLKCKRGLQFDFPLWICFFFFYRTESTHIANQFSISHAGVGPRPQDRSNCRPNEIFRRKISKTSQYRFILSR